MDTVGEWEPPVWGTPLTDRWYTIEELLGAPYFRNADGYMTQYALKIAAEAGALKAVRMGPRGGWRYQRTELWEEWKARYLESSQQHHEERAAKEAARRLGFEEPRTLHQVAYKGAKDSAARLGARRKTYCGITVVATFPADFVEYDASLSMHSNGVPETRWQYRPCNVCARAKERAEK